MTNKDEIENLLNKLPHKLQVRFAYLCCMDIKPLIKHETSLKALSSLELWLKDERLVSRQEILDVAYAAANAAANAAYAANAAAYAAYAANAAANAAAYKEKMNSYLIMLKALIKDMTDLERIVFNMDKI